MRFPSIPTLIRTFSLYSFNATGVRSVYKGAQGVRSATLGKTTLWSMPTVPFLGAFFGQKRDMTEYPGKQSEEYWQAKLTPDQFRVIRQKGTEQPYDNEYDRHMPTEGVYQCAACDQPLYRANHKFKSGCGWPAYFDAIPGAVIRHNDFSFGMPRTEIVCSNCGGHLGHVFKGEGYPTPTNERHCVNSISLLFTDKEPEPKKA